jgi:hypothetical protein
MAKTESGAAGSGAPFTLPADLASHTAEQLAELYAKANAELDTIIAERDPLKLERAGELSAARKSIGARQAELAAEQADIDAKFQTYADELAADSADAPEGEGEVLEGEVVEQPTADAQPAAPQLVTASARPRGGAQTASRELGGLSRVPSLNPSLSGARQHAPTQEAPQAALAITASVGLSGKFGMGDRVESLGDLSALAHDRAKSMTDQSGVPISQPGGTAFAHRARRHTDPYGGVRIATIENQFDTVFSDKTGQDAIAAYINKIQRASNPREMESLVAAGGWCAPSQIRYDFFNIAAQSGMIDLPTFGVERGGIQYPISPSLADTFSPALPWYTAFSNATMPWLWTEGDDILAATGSPTKPCTRVPCSTMDNKRLECYGICVTAGNLADNAWPESTANFLRLVMAAHYHAANARYISAISALATPITGCTAAGSGLTAPVLSTAELSAIDYRSKFGMARTDVMEAVYPEWILGGIRADLAKRTGVEPNLAFNITDADIARWFDVRGIRAQFVQDYQVRAAGQPGASTAITQYPSFTKFLTYAPGTVARGNGMTLDLGIVRDSTLNRTNDFTAAWMEECHLIAKFGHEVREYTVNICPDGTTGAADLTSCCP